MLFKSATDKLQNALKQPMAICDDGTIRKLLKT